MAEITITLKESEFGTLDCDRCPFVDAIWPCAGYGGICKKYDLVPLKRKYKAPKQKEQNIQRTRIPHYFDEPLIK